MKSPGKIDAQRTNMPDALDSVRFKGTSAEREKNTSECLFECREAARKGDVGTLSDTSYHLMIVLQFEAELNVLGDPTTGDCLLHIPATNAQFSTIEEVSRTYSGRCGNLRLEAKRWNAPILQNNIGNIPLHCAVQQQNLDVVRAVYGFIRSGWMPGMEGADKPIERSLYELDDDGIATELTVLVIKNQAGCDVVAEARYVGNEDNAVWCEKAIKTLGPGTKFRSKMEIEGLLSQRSHHWVLTRIETLFKGYMSAN